MLEYIFSSTFNQVAENLYKTIKDHKPLWEMNKNREVNVKVVLWGASLSNEGHELRGMKQLPLDDQFKLIVKKGLEMFSKSISGIKFIFDIDYNYDRYNVYDNQDNILFINKCDMENSYYKVRGFCSLLLKGAYNKAKVICINKNYINFSNNIIPSDASVIFQNKCSAIEHSSSVATLLHELLHAIINVPDITNFSGNVTNGLKENDTAIKYFRNNPQSRCDSVLPYRVLTGKFDGVCSKHDIDGKLMSSEGRAAYLGEIDDKLINLFYERSHFHSIPAKDYVSHKDNFLNMFYFNFARSYILHLNSKTCNKIIMLFDMVLACVGILYGISYLYISMLLAGIFADSFLPNSDKNTLYINNLAKFVSRNLKNGVFYFLLNSYLNAHHNSDNYELACSVLQDFMAGYIGSNVGKLSAKCLNKTVSYSGNKAKRSFLFMYNKSKDVLKKEVDEYPHANLDSAYKMA